MFLTLFACGVTLRGELDADVPAGSRAMLLWTTFEALGVPGESFPVEGREVRIPVPAAPPEPADSLPPNPWWAVAVVVDEELPTEQPLDPALLSHVIAVWPGGAVIDQENEFRILEGWTRPEPSLPLGTSCVWCAEGGACAADSCTDVPFVVGDPLEQAWTIPVGTGTWALGADATDLAFVYTDTTLREAVFRVRAGGLRERVYSGGERLTLYGWHAASGRALVGQYWMDDGSSGAGVVADETLLWSEPRASAVELSPDGRFAAIQLDEDLEVRDAATGEGVVTLDRPAAMVWSPDASFLFVGDRGAVPEAIPLGGVASPTVWPACQGAPPQTLDRCDDEGAFHLLLDPFAQPRRTPEPCDAPRSTWQTWSEAPVAWEPCQGGSQPPD